jgi:hypothetical protein
MGAELNFLVVLYVREKHCSYLLKFSACTTHSSKSLRQLKREKIYKLSVPYLDAIGVIREY